MATTITMAQATTGAVANAPTRFTVTVGNTGATSLTLTDLSVGPVLASQVASIAQPQFLTAMAAAGTGYPTINAAGDVSYGFTVVFHTPNTPGPSPNAPGLGPAGMVTRQPGYSNVYLEGRCLTSDGAAAFFILSVPVLSAVEMFPVPEGGATVHSQGANANLIAALI